MTSVTRVLPKSNAKLEWTGGPLSMYNEPASTHSRTTTMDFAKNERRNTDGKHEKLQSKLVHHVAQSAFQVPAHYELCLQTHNLLTYTKQDEALRKQRHRRSTEKWKIGNCRSNGSCDGQRNSPPTSREKRQINAEDDTKIQTSKTRQPSTSASLKGSQPKPTQLTWWGLQDNNTCSRPKATWHNLHILIGVLVSKSLHTWSKVVSKSISSRVASITTGIIHILREVNALLEKKTWTSEIKEPKWTYPRTMVIKMICETADRSNSNRRELTLLSTTSKHCYITGSFLVTQKSINP